MFENITLVLILVVMVSDATLLTKYKNLHITENYSTSNIAYELEMIDLLGLGQRPLKHMQQQPKLNTSASRFLLEVYEELTKVEEQAHNYKIFKHQRSKRANADNFISQLDQIEIEKCTNIISFASKLPQQHQLGNLSHNLQIFSRPAALHVAFNTNDVPRDLHLVYAALRIYQTPKLAQNTTNQHINITVYRRNYSRKPGRREFLQVTKTNSTIKYRGWLEINITHLLARWLKYGTLERAIYNQELLIEVPSAQLTLISPTMSAVSDKHPFIISYFQGPELITKIQSLRFKRDIQLRKRRKVNYNAAQTTPLKQLSNNDIYKMPKNCERLNFTLDFKDLHMHNWVIAPQKFEAYFCGGECNFPLGSSLNATNHAIVQTLMHLKQPNLPKPCCVPTVLGSISILHYLNEDSVNLSKYPQSVARECGCH